ncbi:MAG: UDP-N-acetylmuramate--L-alanine ligase [Cyanobacteriota bacterium]|nr:UDP-N-acetylmuramate--L-alanine ligase [Cyanobacteriota bacterium]
MSSSVDFSGRPFHFIGIGGIGMSALAYILAKRKLPVYGSDLKSSHITERLESIGSHIFWHQEASNFELFKSNEMESPLSRGDISDRSLLLEGVENENNTKNLGENPGRNTPVPTSKKLFELPQVICSTAIDPGNSEYRAAVELGCPIFHRSDLLAALINDYQSIAVAGTHGKTTTSSMVGFMLLQAGLDPTIVVGGEVNAWSGNARVGQGPFLVAEADESDGSLVKLSAYIGIATNIELDHPDHYQSLQEVVETFKVFKRNCQTLVGCIDCPTVREELNPSISYSLNPELGADYSVSGVEYLSDKTIARVSERGKILGQLQLKLLGEHNLSNALAAVAVGRLLGLEFSAIAQAFASFEGARRRFESRGDYNGILFVDDYAHHPSEIRATLSAASLRAKNKTSSSNSDLSNSEGKLGQKERSQKDRVVAIFQPHRYSRTMTFLKEFAQSFNDADIVVVTDVYSAGEPDNGEINAQSLAEEIAIYHPQVHQCPSLAEVKDCLKEILKPGDLALFLGAGNLNQIIPDVMAFYQPPEDRVVSIAEGSIGA